MANQKSPLPTTFVVLGVTGDLMTKKIAPALFNLHEKGLLPAHFRLIGVSRRDWTDEDLKRHIQAILEVKVRDASPASVRSFLKSVVYHKLTFDAFADYVALGDALKKIDDEHGACSNKLFYLSVPPQFYDTIFTNIHKARLAITDDASGGWTRVVVEKPFGSDEKSAKALDERIARLFKEEQVYRIDHYLAKETLQNILTFRFFNNLFEDNWGRALIEKIYVRELENVGAEDRGPFYESVGALRDVGQNHLLEMIALVAMDEPRDMTADAIRAARAALLETIKPLTPSEIAQKTFRAQYDGYRTIKGVDPKSNVETYFKVALELSHPRWKGVPIFIEAGKRVIDPKRNGEVTEIEVVFKHEEPCLCALYGAEDEENIGGTRAAGVPVRHFKNSITFRQDPSEGITIRFWAKKPGLAMELEERVFDVDLRQGERKSQYTEEYEKLLLDCINGDQTLFVSSREIAAMWRFIDPIVKGWDKGLVPLRRYEPDTEAIIAEASVLIDPPEHAAAKDSGRRLVRKEIGIFGLGKMGANVARQLHEKGWRVVASNRSPGPVEEIKKEGIEGVFSHADLVVQLKAPRIIWLMITAGKGNDEILFGRDGIVQHLKKGDIVIDAANAFYEDTVRRAKLLKKRGIHFVDVGFSGGPSGARKGGSLMIGGEKQIYERLEPLFRDLSVPGGYSYFGAAGAGHFVKMVHNGIEYGMMQSLAEGFAIMKKSPFKLDLEQVANVYNRGSVIESRLVGWLEDSYKLYGQDLKAVSGSVAYTGEGEWTIKTGKKLKVPTPVIEDSFKFRVRSKKSPSYIGKILSALRNRFGGHAIDQGEK
ncbi:MAG TPA: glucose-6-phosphate dehydrogenase [Candidatus Paceibacterota bacterium]|nr:glucose-6-phosphate dehydrogenase [Candidatus Paceibacterota bacterium]